MKPYIMLSFSLLNDLRCICEDSHFTIEKCELRRKYNSPKNIRLASVHSFDVKVGVRRPPPLEEARPSNVMTVRIWPDEVVRGRNSRKRNKAMQRLRGEGALLFWEL